GFRIAGPEELRALPPLRSERTEPGGLARVERIENVRQAHVVGVDPHADRVVRRCDAAESELVAHRDAREGLGLGGDAGLLVATSLAENEEGFVDERAVLRGDGEAHGAPNDRLSIRSICTP